MSLRVFCVSGAAALTAVLAFAPAVQPQGAPPYTLLTREGRHSLAVRTMGGQEMVALDDLAKLFDLAVREDALAGGLTISTKTQTIALTPGQGLASVGGRLVSLPAPPVREGRSWYVPLDFVPRALAPALGTRLEVRRPSRLIVSGDVRVPRVAVRVEPQGTAARVTIEVSPATPHTVAQENGRVIVRFDAEAMDATLPASPAPELVQQIVALDRGVGIALAPGPRFSGYKASTADGDRGSGRITIDVAGPPVEAAPAAEARPAPADPPVVLPVPDAGLRTIVIDAGHGGEEQGARGAQGLSEKDVTLAVARRLKGIVEARLGARVLLTRDADRTVGLDERAAVANNNKADLFISLHASASVRTSMAGAEVFYLSLADYGDQAQRLAQGNHEVLPTFTGGTRDIEVILWEMAQARHIEASADLAQIVEGALRERVPMSPRAIQQAPFRVLVGANMPAVLVEMGFLSNAEQEKQLASEGLQSALAQALADAIVRFRDTRGTPQAARPDPRLAAPPD